MYMMCLQHLYSINKLNTWSSGPCSWGTSSAWLAWKVVCNLRLYQKTRWTFSKNQPFFGLCYQTLRSHTSMEFNAIKSLDLNINRICPREGSLHFLFLNFFFQDFLKAFFTKKLHIILLQIPTVLIQKHINYILFF